MRIFSSLVESRLLYGLPSGCLNAAETRRLDGFQCRCLRQILGTCILPAFLSRVPHERVFEIAGQRRASAVVREQQLVLLGTVLRASQLNPISYFSFTPGTTQPAVSRYIRKVGRPQQEWVHTVMQHARQLAGGEKQLLQMCQSESEWKHFARNATRQQNAV